MARNVKTMKHSNKPNNNLSNVINFLMKKNYN